VVNLLLILTFLILLDLFTFEWRVIGLISLICRVVRKFVNLFSWDHPFVVHIFLTDFRLLSDLNLFALKVLILWVKWSFVIKSSIGELNVLYSLRSWTKIIETLRNTHCFFPFIVLRNSFMRFSRLEVYDLNWSLSNFISFCWTGFTLLSVLILFNTPISPTPRV